MTPDEALLAAVVWYFEALPTQDLGYGITSIGESISKGIGETCSYASKNLCDLGNGRSIIVCSDDGDGPGNGLESA